MEDYLDRLAVEGWSDLRLMPLDQEGKLPAIASRGIKLDSPPGRALLHTPEEAVRALSTGGERGFCLYAGREEHGTEGLLFVDIDDPERLPPEDLPETLTVTSGSARGYHLTYRNDGEVANSKATGDLHGAGEVRASNWYVVLPGSVHPSGGVYHLTKDTPIAPLSEEDLPKELLPGSNSEGSTVKGGQQVEPLQVAGLPDDPAETTNDVGMTLKEVRERSEKLDRLLSDLLPRDYDYHSVSEADMATARLLLLWRFDEATTGALLQAYRDREGRVEGSESKMRRKDYVATTVRKTALLDVEAFDRDLMRAFMEDARENGGRPTVSLESVREVYNVLILIDREQYTVQDIMETDMVARGYAKGASVKRRVRRALHLLVRTGALEDRKSPGFPTQYVDTGLSDLYIPDSL
ncbi:bifunctional DNA primase/polymerase [Natrialba swarupiae]|uniref:bifunctional DNA primase/polymerase n=1 Tax=Natrialba swarupiae TaxID=2448032 RepID=UPI001390AD89|nr:bifunctional DNA primase/polymerase [Natrialba swarupiae]